MKEEVQITTQSYRQAGGKEYGDVGDFMTIAVGAKLTPEQTYNQSPQLILNERLAEKAREIGAKHIFDVRYTDVTAATRQSSSAELIPWHVTGTAYIRLPGTPDYSRTQEFMGWKKRKK